MSSPNRAVKLGFWVLFILIVILISSNIYKGPFQNFTFPDFSFTSTFIYSFESEGLAKIIKEDLNNTKGIYAVLVEDLSGNEKYGFNDKETFPTASLYKLFLMAAVLKQVEEGSLNLEENLIYAKSYLASIYGEVDFGYEDAPETLVYTADEALTRLARNSDNFASIMLAEKIGWDKLPQMAKELGAQNTKLIAPFATDARDIGLFFKKLYLGEVVSSRVSAQILDYLSLNQINDRLPSLLPLIPQNQPDGWRVVHKTGELPGVRNDAGIVYIKTEDQYFDGSENQLEKKEEKAYVIVLLSKDLPYEDDAVDTLARISKHVYDYFEKKYNSR
jgi:beta-lactamase class A